MSWNSTAVRGIQGARRSPRRSCSTATSRLSVLRAGSASSGPWSLVSFATQARHWRGRVGHGTPRAPGRALVEKQANGDGPVDACFKAMEQATGLSVNLRKFEVRSVSEGEDAQGEALVYVEYNARTYRGSSVSTNIIESSVRGVPRGHQPRRAQPRERLREPCRSGARTRAPRRPQSDIHQIGGSVSCPSSPRSSSGSTASSCPGKRPRCTSWLMPCTTAHPYSKASAPMRRRKGLAFSA